MFNTFYENAGCDMTASIPRQVHSPKLIGWVRTDLMKKKREPQTWLKVLWSHVIKTKLCGLLEQKLCCKQLIAL